MKITIGDVAQKAGVSKTTVSRIINGNYNNNTEETVQKVLDTIKELDYRPNALAKGLKSSRTNVIGMVLSNLKNPFWANVLEGTEEACQELGFNLMICNSGEDPELEEQYIKEFQMRQVDGIVINPTAINTKLYNDLVMEEYPMVFINRKVDGIETHNVVVDNIKGAFMAVDHLLKKNRKNVVSIAYKNKYVSTWRERLEGYRAAMLAHGYSSSEFNILEIEREKGNIKGIIIDFLKSNPSIDGIFSTNNMITLEIVDAIKDLELKIPEDIAIVGYDETIWAKHLDPPLTTIKQPAKELGKVSAKILIETIQNNNFDKPQKIILQPELIIRKSCGATSASVVWAVKK
ncbi:LacI family DNA-binding transcriptional regulator [Aquibacillus salsiterrae]|uniref:LacI family transcriptional regulator n=1 Tax=Aquibacillus salsiterrae TaxID=2950439 RepID=A0A9X3WK50_9BACI|nr:LacI family DNA-binding transcriptional regulator [Aquibacillus salsiterrae]MDC3418561.1 LacI family transcriptional regulator [Aquibacillus salsiterrae]